MTPKTREEMERYIGKDITITEENFDDYVTVKYNYILPDVLREIISEKLEEFRLARNKESE